MFHQIWMKNFQHKLLLTDAKVSKILKAFANGSSADIKIPKTNCLRWYKLEDVYLVYLII